MFARLDLHDNATRYGSTRWDLCVTVLGQHTINIITANIGSRIIRHIIYSSSS